MEYRLANGSAITDEDIERECAEYESGSLTPKKRRPHAAALASGVLRIFLN